jgi:MFS family permease
MSRREQRPDSLHGNRDFALLWSGETISGLGSAVTVVALPLLVLQTLHGTAFQVGLVVAAQELGWILIGFPTGALVDRADRRRVAIGSDWLRAGALATLPLAVVAGGLTMSHVLLVALLLGLATVTFTIAYSSFLPQVVTAEQLVPANARVQLSQSIALLAGPALAGLLVGLTSPSTALVADAVSFALSALLLQSIRSRGRFGPRHAAGAPRPTLLRDISEGLRFVFGDTRFRMLTLASSQFNFCVGASQAVVVLFLTRTVGLSAAHTGLLLSSAGAGGAVAALLSGPVVRRYGLSRAALGSSIIGGLVGLLVPMTTPGQGLLLFAVGYAVLTVGAVIFNVVSSSFRMASCPPELLGRMTASTRVFTWGVGPLGALFGGGLASAAGARTAMWVIYIGYALCPLWLLLSSARVLQPPSEEAPEPTPGETMAGRAEP